LTVGIKHVYFWYSEGSGFDKKKGIFGKVGKMCNLTCAGWLEDGTAVAAGTNGSIYLWDKNVCSKQVPITKGNAAIHTMRIVDNQIICGGWD